MSAPEPSDERFALLVSIAVTAVLGALGIIWGVVGGSQMILFDGVFAFVGIVMSGLLLQASALAEHGPTRRYPYGKQGATPLVIGVQGFVLLATLLYAAVESVFTILDGGSDVTPGWAIVYGVIAAAASVATWRWLRGKAGSSDLVAAEALAWRVGALRGIGMVIGFATMWFLIDSSWEGAAPYIDPAMVLVTCVAFVATPARMVRHTIIELLEGAPPPEVQAPVHEAITEIRAAFDLREPVVRMTKVGPKLYVEIDVAVQPDVTIGKEDEVRAALQRRLDPLPYEVWLNLDFTPASPATDHR